MFRRLEPQASHGELEDSMMTKGLIWTPSCGSLISRRFRSVVAFSTLRRQQ